VLVPLGTQESQRLGLHDRLWGPGARPLGYGVLTLDLVATG
jgi:hypothetical protein